MVLRETDDDRRGVTRPAGPRTRVGLCVAGYHDVVSSAETLSTLTREHPETFAEQAGITLADTPSPLFRLLVLTALLSANLDPHLGLRTARALSEAGYTTAAHLADASDDDRWRVLSESKYLRKEQTARQLGDLAEHCVTAYDGDLRRLRDEAGDVEVIREALCGFTGIGATGAGIFLREVQTVWPTVQPYADDRVLDLARERDLPHTVRGLADAAGTDDLAHVGAALVVDDMERRSSQGG